MTLFVLIAAFFGSLALVAGLFVWIFGREAREQDARFHRNMKELQEAREKGEL